MSHFINLLATVVSSIASIYFIILSFKTKILQKGIILLTIGTFIAITIHSFLELLESYNYLKIENLLVIMPIFVAVGSVLIVIGSFQIIREVTNPLIMLKRATNEISKGNLEIKIEIKSKDELGELASSFNKMVGDIKKSNSDINSLNKNLDLKVKERTIELDNKIKELERINKLTIGRELKMIELKKKMNDFVRN